MIRVGLCGGIGSGKSTICRIFAERGVAVYSSDERAKALMCNDAQLREAITHCFGEACYDGTTLNRAYLASRVFVSPTLLQQLNDIVHPAVKADFEQWCLQQQGAYVILESAILFESGFDDVVDCTVAVLAPRALRLERAMQRDGASREQIEQRMSAQLSDDELVARADYAMVNIMLDDVRRDVEELDGRLRMRAARG